MASPTHPEREQIRIEDVLAALGNPLRMTAIRVLAAEGERRCGDIVDDVSSSTLTHHWRVLRQSGVIHQRASGRELLLSLRRDDLDARFPGLLDAILAAPDADQPLSKR